MIQMQEEKQQELPQQRQSNQLNTAFQLIRKVGSKGKYQYKLLIIFMIIWALNSILIMNSLFFIPMDFDCSSMGLIQSECYDAVCSLPTQQRIQFQNKSNNYRKNIATQLGRSYVCQKQFYLDLATTMIYLGNFVGFMIFSSFADKFGRRRILLISWAIYTFGSILLSFSQNLIMAGMSEFLLGLGASTGLNLTLAFLAQVFENQDRQKFTILLEAMYPVGGLIFVLQVMFIYNWIIITIISMVIPSIVILFFIATYVQQTPIFLLAQGIPKTLKALNRIGKINMGSKDILKKHDVLKVMRLPQEGDKHSDEPLQQVKDSATYKITDLFAYPSLRRKVIPFSLSYFAVCGIYYGLNFMLDQFGMDVFTTSIILWTSEIFVYYPLYRTIQIIPRKKCSSINFLIIGICTTIQLFLKDTSSCGFCFQFYLKIFLLIVFKIAVALQLAIMNVYMVELYPNKIQATAAGFTISMGAAATILCPIGIGLLKRSGVNPILAFIMFAYIGFGMSFMITQTVGKQMEDEIMEVRCLMDDKIAYEALNPQYKQTISKSQIFPKAENEQYIQRVKSGFE